MDRVQLVCDDGTIAVHIYEDRAIGGRATLASLVYGPYRLSGLIGESGAVFLSEKYTDTFSGTMVVDSLKQRLAVAGYLSLSGVGRQIDRTLPCQKMIAVR